ncbi:MAG: hypothetical protein JJE25_04550, partial [Bacteroidia bacterium]|nr:hypothetical protein [Bacteroidia bacterium]
MTKKLLFLAFVLYSGVALCTNITIADAGFTFSPSTVTINLGDSVNFAIASAHNAAEVSQTTWNTNGNTQLPGGFSTPFGGGLVLPANLTVGTHWYVCQAHASSGMKGIIIVQNTAGIATGPAAASLYLNTANPVTQELQVTYSIPKTTRLSIRVYNIIGIEVSAFVSASQTAGT